MLQTERRKPARPRAAIFRPVVGVLLALSGCDGQSEHSLNAALACIKDKQDQGLTLNSAKLSCAKAHERLFADGETYGLDGTLFKISGTDYRLEVRNNSSKVVTGMYLRLHPITNGQTDTVTVIAGHVGPIWLEPYASGQYMVRMTPALDWGAKFSFSFKQVLGLDVPG